ncbi:MAG: NAD-binding protein [Chloroflexi bacterium]|nr:NAD-binding protein [Chloroflexota bacterium]
MAAGETWTPTSFTVCRSSRRVWRSGNASPTCCPVVSLCPAGTPVPGAWRTQFEPPSFRQALARKDIALANELARELSVPMPVANIVEQVAIQCGNRGWGDMDTHVIYRLQELAAGVEIRQR